ncbi:pilin N-terminal domain-containing protein [Corynebacterium sp. CCM 9203]|uniref:pilin N-terminal domain-containing protein n=1 Tax=Corynebacterium sp. CCM 9203 TaxID=3057615 RepID=UPI003525B528
MIIASALSVNLVPLAGAAVVTGNVGNLTAESIQVGRTVKLTLHKEPANPYDDIPPGELPPGDVRGATFTLERLGGYDLSDPEVWKSFNELNISDTKNSEVLDTFNAVTNSEGNAVFQELPMGLYRVSETPPDEPAKNFRISAPFLISLPVGDETGSSWAYDVSVTPKIKPRDEVPGSSGGSGGVIPVPIPIPVPGKTPGSSEVPHGPGMDTTPKPRLPEMQEEQQTSTKGILEYLPNTGANVIGLYVIGLVLTALGFVILRRRKRSGH